MMEESESNPDIAIVGGGLAGGLIALALAAKRPGKRLLLIDQGPRFGGNHIWSFFESDVAAEDRWLVEPLITARWNGYTVHFPAHSRDLSTHYRSIASEGLDARLRAVLPAASLLPATRTAALGHDRVTLEDGRTIRAGAVIDARGATGLHGMAGGWQKFHGRLLRLTAPHGLALPIVMDARVAQHDGYRFVYSLPFSETEIFVEDTYYSADPVLDVATMQGRIADYAAQAGWQVEQVLREESGRLPVIAGGDFESFWSEGEASIARAGARAALVHPLTSYSLPDSVRFATHLSGLDDLSGATLAAESYKWARAHWHGGKFYRKLTRMLFGAARPDERYKMLERFYTMPEGLIERFYAGASGIGDELRILAGKPPVPLIGAMASLAGRGYPLARLDAVAELGA